MAPLSQQKNHYDDDSCSIDETMLEITYNHNTTETTTTSTTDTKKETKKRLTSRRKKKQGKNKKSVSFHDEVSMMEVLGRTDYTAQETEAVWFTEEEFFQTKKDYYEALHFRMTAAAYKAYTSIHTSSDTEYYVVDGLDDFMFNDPREQAEIQRMSINEVLYEQQLQQEEGVQVPEYLADVYFETSSVSAKKAQQRGLWYAQQVVVTK